MSGECDGKIGFSSERAALDELGRIIVRAMNGERTGRRHWFGDASPLERGVYRCRVCDRWHLTSRPIGGAIVVDRS